MAMGHLLELGHRAPAVLSFRLTGHGHVGLVDEKERRGVTAAVARERLAGSADAMAAAGLGWDEVLVEECASSSVDAGRDGAHELLDRAPATTAIFAFSDLLALGARQAALERGLSVPGDLSIVGFDGCAGEAEGLTTIYQPEHEKGRIAAERLLEGLAGGPRRPERHILPSHLVVRGSTAPPPDR
jgi:LacI family transcriptional regulator